MNKHRMPYGQDIKYSRHTLAWPKSYTNLKYKYAKNTSRSAHLDLRGPNPEVLQQPGDLHLLPPVTQGATLAAPALGPGTRLAPH